MKLRSRLLCLLLMTAISASCASAGESSGPEEEVNALPWRDAWTPPEDWQTMAPIYFEELVLAELPDGTRTILERPVMKELTRALDKQDQSSVRAAIILGRANSRIAGNRLLSRLAKRQLSTERHGDAGDVVAAAAIANLPSPQRWSRIINLVNGKNPHPDLEVRVECASTALHMGNDEAIPFLLQVLRIGTWEGQNDVLDFTPADTTAWARGRASEALSKRAGVPITYHSDAPIANRERETRRLADLLAETQATDAD